MNILCSTIAASTLILSPVTGPQRQNTVDYFDQKIQVTERVLSRKIVEDIARVQAPDSDAFPHYTESLMRAAIARSITKNRQNCRAVTTHCQKSPRIKALNATEECVLVRD